MKEFFNWKSLTTITTTLCVALSVATVQGQENADMYYANANQQECCDPCSTGNFAKIAIGVGAIALAGLVGYGVAESTSKKGKHGDSGSSGTSGFQGNPGPAGPQGFTGVTGPTGGTGATGLGVTGPQGPTGATAQLPFAPGGSLEFTISATPTVGFTLTAFVVDPEQNVYSWTFSNAQAHTFTFDTLGVNPLPFIGNYKWGFYIEDVFPNDSALFTAPPATAVITLDGGDAVTYAPPFQLVWTQGDQYVSDIGYDPLASPNPVPLP